MIAESLALLALAGGPPGPPGPPPGNGTELPSAPGTAPAFVPPGSAAAIPSATTPGLLRDGAVAFNRTRRTFALQLACQAKGSVKVRALRATIAKAGYRCRDHRATARFTVTRKLAKRLARRPQTPATAVVSQAGKAARLSFTLTSGKRAARAPGFWTDGHLDCQQGFLVEPDFTTKQPTPISTRGWVAWYTAASGWHWLGSGGEDRGRWNTWTASVAGVSQFHPNGATVPVPWTLGPIAVPAGQGIYATGVYEIVYWVGGHPDHQWRYVNAGTTGAVAAGGGTQYCVYP